MSIMNEIKKELNTISTTNGDTAYASTFNANLDFFGISGTSRHNRELENIFDKAYSEDKKMALKNLLYLRDIRGGVGERDSFRRILNWLIIEDAQVAIKLLPIIAEYGRYDDILVYLDHNPTKDIAACFIMHTLMEDKKLKEMGATYSLCAKWMPSVNASSKKTREYALKICALTNTKVADYRKLLSYLRKDMIVETNLTQKDYSFDYAKLPARALSKYTYAFNEHDKERYDSYKQSLIKGEVKAKVNTLFPYEIIKKTEIDEELAESQWKAIPRSEDKGNTIVVRDGSASMSGLPLDVATSLSMLFAEQLKGEFKDKFITFSANPKLVTIKGKTLREKNEYIRQNYYDMENTNIAKVYDLLYKASLKITDGNFIDRVVIISDMQFDEGCNNVPTYETLKEKFESANIPLPEIVYWNVNSMCVGFPAMPEPNIRLVSGFSVNIINMIINNSEVASPVEFMESVLAKYDEVVDCLLG